MVQRNPKYSVRGPVLESYGYVERFQQHMTTLEFECAHGTKVEPSYGYFAETRRENTNKSRLFIYIPEEDINGDPLFADVISYQSDYNEYICKACISRQIVDKSAVFLFGATVWDSKLIYLDEVHNTRETVTIIEQETVTASEYDGLLNGENEAVYSLTQTKPTEGLVGDVFTSFKKVKCNWYVKKEETITAKGFTYKATENYYWPPVLLGTTNPFDFGILEGDKAGVTYTAGILLDYRLQQSFNGPTEVNVLVAWTETANLTAVNSVDYMQPDSINYQGIFVNVGVPECLHDAITITESVGTNHPTLTAGQTRSKSYAATNHTLWPATIVGSVQVRPHKGGFITTTKTYTRPS